ncbi:MAG: Multi-sensor signal transduction histidine kinase [Chloroflexi bacterium]|nr:MAG: Multi-sensor signal transduction histidine kinase [Chloroflexota bacterium]
MSGNVERCVLSGFNHPPNKKSNWRGFTLQLFLIIVLPLTGLLLAVAFGSQTLHHDAMRSLVGDRDLRTVRAASSSLEREISHMTSMIQILSRNLSGKSDFTSLLLSKEEISSIFDGGIALYHTDGSLIHSSTTQIDWQTIPTQISDTFNKTLENISHPTFSPLISPPGNPHSYIFIGILTDQHKVLVGAFSPDRFIENAIGSLASSGQTTVLVVSPAKTIGNFDVLYRGGPFKIDESVPSHPGIQEVLNGESGINFYQGSEGEHVVAFNPISAIGWGLVIEEAWEDIASPYLITTQSAPLVIVPVFLLALLAIWFGARRIVTPLQNLEKQAASLAMGDFDPIHQPVGGIEEIRNLQSELIEMADKLKAAQQSLRSYIGAITAGIENERRSLARELHDDTTQSLIALNQRIQMVLINSPETQKNSLSELQIMVQQSMTNLRRMIRGLRPIYLEDLGLVASLEMLVGEMEQSANIPTTFTSMGQERRLDPQSEMSLYRMVQESLNNVIHHSSAKHAWVDMEFTGTDLTVKIRDDGKGFVVPTNPAEFPEKGHFGLLGLQERADLINADLNIASNPGKGTNISIRLSYSANQNHE